MSTLKIRAVLGHRSAVAVVLLGAAFPVACVSTPAPPPPEQMSRTAAKTAPADLQLLCANAAAKSGNLKADKILPVSSSQIDSKTFQVDLDAGGKKTSCLVDTDGNVKSVQPL
ncbi:hypothetical protein [Mesorhizobium sp. B1-1-8]|uniref:hypothetical protein n=1 Tax=Mesorhizobium sp. B1-1-8 TaxID=2589976 RepID=UPI001D00982A|nr:hypothetical protein [Mesorhizobium sp. B1-1-8]UCI05662.1 hypothetical protein FJ974_17660 [Mesorhizobium sp. B1-1-8]